MPDLTLRQIRARFGRCSDSAHKQMGLRRVTDALALGDRNPQRVRELHEEAANHLAYAIAIDSRDAWRRQNRSR